MFGSLIVVPIMGTVDTPLIARDTLHRHQFLMIGAVVVNHVFSYSDVLCRRNSDFRANFAINSDLSATECPACAFGL